MIADTWRDRHTILLLCTFGFAGTMAARVVISPVVPDITTTFGVSTGSIGLALSGMWAAYALAQFPSGVLADRFGERRVVIVALAATGTTGLLVALSPTFFAFVALVVVLGGAAGLVYSPSAMLVTKRSPETGRAMGVFIAGGPAAGLLAPPVAVAVAAAFGWRAGVAVGATVALVAVVLLAWRIGPTPAAQPDRSLRESVDIDVAITLLSRPAIARTVLLALLGAFVWQSTASFLPAFLETHRGYSRSTASLLFSGYFAVHGLSQPLTGTLSDRFSRDAAATLTMTFGVLGYGLLVVGSSFATTVFAVGCIGLAMSWGAPLQSRFMDLLSDEERGTGFGLVRTVYMLLGALGSLVTGVVVDVAGWRVAFSVLTGFMAVGVAVLLVDRITRS